MFYSSTACLISQIIFLLIILIPFKSKAVGPFAGPQYKVYKLGYLEGGFQMERFYTDANYDDKGNIESLGSTYRNYLRSYDYSYKGRLTYTPNFAISGGFINHSVDTDDGKLVRSRSGLSEVFLGADYRWVFGETELIFEYKGAYSLYKVPTADNTEYPIWADGVNSGLAAVFLQRKFGSSFGYVFGGYNYRDDGLSDNYLMGLGLQFAFDGWVVGGEIKGALLAGNDLLYDSTNSKRHEQIKEVNAGSYKYYSTNPEWATLEVNCKFRLTSQLAFNAGGGTIFKGINMADGSFLYLGLQVQWPVFLQEISGQAEVQKKAPDFIPNAPSIKKKNEDASK
jgi:hypothetical protein